MSLKNPNRRSNRPKAEATGPLLEVTDLSTTFTSDRGYVRAVNNVSLRLERGKTLGIVGESGSGKSVLSRSIMGLLPGNAIRTGSIKFEGRELIDADSQSMRDMWGTQMAMVFQDPMTALNPVQRVGRQITESLLHHTDIGKKAANESALTLMAAVGIPEPERRLRQYPHELSGGMRQRVMIAISLACGPKILFADEPTTALDVTVQAQILDLLKEQQSERFMAMILVTHDLGVVAGRTDEIAVMYAGRIVERAPSRVLFREMRMPYSEALLNSIPKLDHKNHTRLEAIGGRPPDLVNLPEGCKFAPRCPNVQEKCLAEEPALMEHGTPGHQYACFYPVGTPEGAEAKARNLAQAAKRTGGVAPAAPAAGSVS